MTWTRALLYLALWIILTTYYVVWERPSIRRPPFPIEPTAARQRLIPFPAAAITTFELEAQGTRMQCRYERGQWRVLEPAEVQVPADLITVMVTALAELPPVDVIAASQDGHGADFGLADPTARVRVGDGTTTVALQFGTRNPSRTAVYARRDGAAEILLVGLNVQYYMDLLIEALRRHAT
jgi:hypothetical protein